MCFENPACFEVQILKIFVQRFEPAVTRCLTKKQPDPAKVQSTGRLSMFVVKYRLSFPSGNLDHWSALSSLEAL